MVEIRKEIFIHSVIVLPDYNKKWYVLTGVSEMPQYQFHEAQLKRVSGYVQTWQS
jgi:hypothetical protein